MTPFPVERAESTALTELTIEAFGPEGESDREAPGSSPRSHRTPPKRPMAHSSHISGTARSTMAMT